MRKEDKIIINGIQVTIKELTVAEVRDWMMDMVSMESAKDDTNMVDTVNTVMDQGLFEEIGIGDILRMTNLAQDNLNEFTPSELRAVVDKCKVLNPDFFGMRKRVLTTASKRV